MAAEDDPFDEEIASEDWADLASLLADPLMWEEPDPSTEDAIVAAIAAEVGHPTRAGEDPPPTTSTPSRPEPTGVAGVPVSASISASRRWLAPIAAGVAAALVVLAGFALLDGGRGDDEGLDLALEGTELAPDASARALVVTTAEGTRIDLDVSGLPPAPPGTYYQAWLLRDAGDKVTAGTFHVRGGDGEIELWAGVSMVDYPLLSITLQDLHGGTESSGRVVLRGSVADT